jgi:hypothetical protein
MGHEQEENQQREPWGFRWVRTKKSWGSLREISEMVFEISVTYLSRVTGSFHTPNLLGSDTKVSLMFRYERDECTDNSILSLRKCDWR